MTTGKNFNNPSSQQRILVAPLEWGLGHATRCIPIIHELLSVQCEVFIAAEGATRALLEQEFPSLTFLALAGYRMQYSRNEKALPWKLLLQFPKMGIRIFKEHQWLKKIVKEYAIDAVISDNRFGMYHRTIPSVYITHQLAIKTGNAFTEKIAQSIHNFFIRKYPVCWVPDAEQDGLAGALSHPKNRPQKIKYIGPLSRFEWLDKKNKYDLLISISGPEPQRTLLEEQLLPDLEVYPGKVLFIRGLPNNAHSLQCKNPLVEINNHLPATLFNEAIQRSDMIISRCGYTTVMDLVKLQKKAILIPTPGQTEQEYLAGYLREKKMFYTLPQKDFRLKHALSEAAAFPFAIPTFDMDEYKEAVRQFVQSL